MNILVPINLGYNSLSVDLDDCELKESLNNLKNKLSLSIDKIAIFMKICEKYDVTQNDIIREIGCVFVKIHNNKMYAELSKNDLIFNVVEINNTNTSLYDTSLDDSDDDTPNYMALTSPYDDMRNIPNETAIETNSARKQKIDNLINSIFDKSHDDESALAVDNPEEYLNNPVDDKNILSDSIYINNKYIDKVNNYYKEN